MAFFSALIPEDLGRYSRLVQEVIAVRRHVDLLRWLQGDVQHYLPHEIMVAAWGDFSQGLIHFDIVSALPGVRTEHVDSTRLAPLLQKLFVRWISHDKTPCTLGAGESGLFSSDTGLQCALGDALQDMRSSLVHGISDERGRHDCLYVIFSSRPALGDATRSAMEVLLPYLDTALRQIAHLPRQKPDDPPPAAPARNGEGHSLSSREVEIIEWVRKGKTNYEIGCILDISAFTVKNHLQRIFKKIDVYNRMQAVTKFESFSRNA